MLSDLSKCKCLCFSARVGTIIIGFIDVVLGIFGLSLLLLNPLERHKILDPLANDSQEQNTIDSVGDAVQLLLEFWLPAFFLFALGVVLIIAGITRNSCSIIFSFVFHTLFLAGLIASLFSLIISHRISNLIGLLPVFLITSLQIYFYTILGIYFKEQEAISNRREVEDKEMLVIRSSCSSSSTSTTSKV